MDIYQELWLCQCVVCYEPATIYWVRLCNCKTDLCLSCYFKIKHSHGGLPPRCPTCRENIPGIDPRRGRKMSRKTAWRARKNWETEFSKMTRGNNDAYEPRQVSKPEKDWTIWTVKELTGIPINFRDRSGAGCCENVEMARAFVKMLIDMIWYQYETQCGEFA